VLLVAGCDASRARLLFTFLLFFTTFPLHQLVDGVHHEEPAQVQGSGSRVQDFEVSAQGIRTGSEVLGVGAGVCGCDKGQLTPQG
jgi:hypothetical protein